MSKSVLPEYTDVTLPKAEVDELQDTKRKYERVKKAHKIGLGMLLFAGLCLFLNAPHDPPHHELRPFDHHGGEMHRVHEGVDAFEAHDFEHPATPPPMLGKDCGDKARKAHKMKGKGMKHHGGKEMKEMKHHGAKKAKEAKEAEKAEKSDKVEESREEDQSDAESDSDSDN
ncbi:hypothetical protein OGAPHI_001054 [Ogataea philodendri]|uniref:Uncharacterized protein n=1 Tax=Ogataea philodendri TaxID=1378263 RepID=A0A9P8PFJ6_9ASCO|nr:uncharacterized protein OGAPHI_001054 [Ogataea philodendri]KAH3670539.1 hypothetical protein OGAPHI_001054 [Ogataea philodendri]